MNTSTLYTSVTVWHSRHSGQHSVNIFSLLVFKLTADALQCIVPPSAGPTLSLRDKSKHCKNSER